MQRDLYSAFLAAYLDPATLLPSCAQYVVPWEGAEARLRAAHERVHQRANEGHIVPRTLAVPEPERVCPEVEANLHQSLLPPPMRQVGSVDGTLEPPVF